MVIRVTDIQQTNNFIEQINTQRNLIDETRYQVSSGIRVGEASDDPGRAGTISELQATVQRLTRHKERIDTSTAILEAQVTAHDTTQNIMLRAKEIAIQAANGTIPDDVRASMSREVFQLRDQLIGIVNTRVQGSYIFGGAQDDVAPYSLVPNVADMYNPPDTTDPDYQDDISIEAAERYVWTGDDSSTSPNAPLIGVDQTRTIQITDSEQLRISSSGEVYRDAITSLEVLGRALAGYDTDLVTVESQAAVPANDNLYASAHDVPSGTGTDWYGTQAHDVAYSNQTAAILNAVGLIESASVNDIEVERTSVGARLARMQQSREMLDVLILDSQKARASIQDADIFEAASKLSSMEVSLQALLSTGARISSLTLLNYI